MVCEERRSLLLCEGGGALGLLEGIGGVLMLCEEGALLLGEDRVGDIGVNGRSLVFSGPLTYTDSTS